MQNFAPEGFSDWRTLLHSGYFYMWSRYRCITMCSPRDKCLQLAEVQCVTTPLLEKCAATALTDSCDVQGIEQVTVTAAG